MARSEGRSPQDLLLEALRSLPAEQRDTVLAWLLGRLGTAALDLGLARSLLAQPVAGHSRERARGFVLSHAGAALGGEQQVVPVRFSADQHAALREWCQQHGFSMATVVRGLVAQFLETQPLRGNQEIDDGS